ncbi:response regulator [Cupriavidus basilensis]
MRKVLIIEDDDPKLDQIVEYLTQSSGNFDMTVAKSLNSACRQIDDNAFDVVLLDMSIPTFDGGKTANATGRQRTYGGKDFLTYMWEMENETPVIVVTQYNDFPGEDGALDMTQLHAQLDGEFPDVYKGHVYFEHNSDAWKSKLDRMLGVC